MSFKNSVCLILGGGKSSRMGQDKANLRFIYKKREISLVNYLCEKLQPLFDEIYFCAKKKPNNLGCEFLKDNYEYYHPINALKTFANFQIPNSNSVFVIAVDFANIKKSTIKRLYYRHKKCKTSVVAKSIKTHFLCGFYKKSDFIYLNEFDENCKIMDFFNKTKAISLKFKNDEIFLNMNTKSDFKKFLKSNKYLKKYDIN